jgi:cell division protein FtsN
MVQKNSKRSPQKGSKQPGFSMQTFLAGLVVGALATHFLPILLENKDLTTEQASPKPLPDTKPVFQFPKILKGIEIAVPNAEPESQTETDITYLLQVGSFINQKDAESLRVRLLLMNFKAFVEPFKTDSGDNWHRVLVGPYNSENETVGARTKLAENDIKSLLLKRKPE